MKMSKFQESVVQTTWPNDNYFDWWLGHNETEQLRMDYQKYLKVKLRFLTCFRKFLVLIFTPFSFVTTSLTKHFNGYVIKLPLKFKKESLFGNCF